MDKNDNSRLMTKANMISHSINKILCNKTASFITIISIKILQISTLKKNIIYRICNNNIIIDNRCLASRNLGKILIDDKKELYNFIRINIDHCINISQITLSSLNEMKHNNIYNKQFGSNAILNNLDLFDDKLKILYILTSILSETIYGLNNIDINDYYNLLICDIKKIIIIYTLNNLKYLFKYSSILSKKYNISYDQLLKIQNNIMYDINFELMNVKKS